MGLRHTNAKGQDYYLHSKQFTLGNGEQQRIFYFARNERPAEALEAVPTGYGIVESQKTGLPFLKRVG